MGECVLRFHRSVGQNIFPPWIPAPFFLGAEKGGRKIFRNFSRFPNAKLKVGHLQHRTPQDKQTT